jgi:acyl carrier protein
MGLDGVELIMAIEKEFNIIITEQEAYNTLTPNDLTDLIFTKLRQDGETGCKSQKQFYFVREMIVEISGVPKNEITPNTHLSEIFKRKDQKHHLIALTKALAGREGVHLQFGKPKWLKWLIYLCGLVIFVYSLLGSNYNIGSSIFFTLLFLIIFHFASLSLNDELPKNYQTVKDLVKIKSSPDSKSWKREDVYQKVKDMLVEQLGVNPELVLPNSHFIDDLGMG